MWEFCCCYCQLAYRTAVVRCCKHDPHTTSPGHRATQHCIQLHSELNLRTCCCLVETELLLLQQCTNTSLHICIQVQMELCPEIDKIMCNLLCGH